MGRWGPDGPPPEAYSRLTDPERFRPLHAATEALISELEASFDLERTDGGTDEELERAKLARPLVRLRPRDPNAAPLTVAFTAFPGIGLRAGLWFMESFPSCGCDACDETADIEGERMREVVDNVVAGRFRESISVPLVDLPLIGDGWHSSEQWSDSGRRSSRSRIDHERASAMLAAAGRPSIDWAPWPPRM